MFIVSLRREVLLLFLMIRRSSFHKELSLYRIVIDYRKLNKTIRRDHYPLPFIDQMLERLSKHTHFCFLDGYSGFSQIPVSQPDQEKTTFTCPFGTYAYRRMPFGLCNAPATFQRCMTAIFSDFCEKIVEVLWMNFLFMGILLMIL